MTTSKSQVERPEAMQLEAAMQTRLGQLAELLCEYSAAQAAWVVVCSDREGAHFYELVEHNKLRRRGGWDDNATTDPLRTESSHAESSHTESSHTESSHTGAMVDAGVARTALQNMEMQRVEVGQHDGEPELQYSWVYIPAIHAPQGCVVCLRFVGHGEPTHRQQQMLMRIVSLWRHSPGGLSSEPDGTPTLSNQASQELHQIESALKLGNRVTTSLDKRETAFQVANELQTFLDVDRVTVLERVGKKMRVAAVSGQATFNRRSNVVRSTERLCDGLSSSNRIVHFSGERQEFEFDESLESAVDWYLEESFAEAFSLIPIAADGAADPDSESEQLSEVINPGKQAQTRPSGAILIESFSRPIDHNVLESRWELARPQVTQQFNHAKQHSDLFALPVLRKLTRLTSIYRGQTRRTAILATCVLGLLLVASLWIQSDFRIRCEGHLQPRAMHHVFVKKDGVVFDVLVKEGQVVRRGDELLRLDNRELELEYAEIAGNLSQKVEERRTLLFQRSSQLNSSAGRVAKAGLAEQSGMLEREIASLEQKLALKESQLADLIIKAPFDGTIIGWNVDRKYLNRPLDEGTRLFSLAKNAQERILELKVPDHRSGYVQASYSAATKKNERLRVEFTLASFPNSRFAGVVSHVNPGLEQDSDLGYVLPVEAEPTGELPDDLRTGIPVVAKILCGQRSFLYCKTYEFRHWLQRKTFDYLY